MPTTILSVDLTEVGQTLDMEKQENGSYVSETGDYIMNSSRTSVINAATHEIFSFNVTGEEIKLKRKEKKLRKSIINAFNEMFDGEYYDSSTDTNIHQYVIDDAINDGIITVDELLMIVRNNIEPRLD